MRARCRTLLVALLVGLFSAAAFAEFGPEGNGSGGANTSGEANRNRYDEECPCVADLFGVDTTLTGLPIQDQIRDPSPDRLRDGSCGDGDGPVGTPNEFPGEFRNAW